MNFENALAEAREKRDARTKYIAVVLHRKTKCYVAQEGDNENSFTIMDDKYNVKQGLTLIELQAVLIILEISTEEGWICNN